VAERGTPEYKAESYSLGFRLGDSLGEIIMPIVVGVLLVRNAPLVPHGTASWLLAAGSILPGVLARPLLKRIDPSPEPHPAKLVVKIVSLVAVLAVMVVGAANGALPSVAAGALAARMSQLVRYDGQKVFGAWAVVLGAVAAMPTLLHAKVTLLSGQSGTFGHGLDDAVRLAAIAGLMAALGALARREVEDKQAIDDAIAAERGRIARELHDVVAHQMTAVVLQAQGASAMLDREPERTRDALGVIETTSREALVELRRMLGVLRDEAGAGVAGPSSPPEGPQPTLEDVIELVKDFKHSQASLSIESDVPAGVQVSVYRIVQEALTNARRYAPGSGVVVDVVADDDTLTLTVRDNGPAPDEATPDVQGAGLGLTGMRERAELLGGELHAGPRADGDGWEVVATLPLEPADESVASE
jgi:signal transduction histidine kinase